MVTYDHSTIILTPPDMLSCVRLGWSMPENNKTNNVLPEIYIYLYALSIVYSIMIAAKMIQM